MSLERSYTDECRLQQKKRKFEDLISEDEIIDVKIKIAKKEYLISLKQKELNRIGKNIADPNCGVCVVCLTNAADHALVPCGHRNYCSTCVKPAIRCYVCRQLSHRSIKIYT